MARSLYKSATARRPQSTHLYHEESALIDSTTTVMEACGSCHNLNTIHGHNRSESSLGVGVNVPGFSGTASVTGSGNLTMSASVGTGVVATSTATHYRNTGPHVSVSGSRSVTLSGSNGTTSARQDNTRVGN
jgi:hypothetical protein